MELKDFNTIKELLSKGCSAREISSLTERSLGTISIINRFNSYGEYQEYNRNRFKKYEDSSKSEEIVTVSGIHTRTLSEALDLLDKEFDNLKYAIEEVVMLSVEQRLTDYKRENEAEIAALKTVVEASKSSNIASILRERLMGKV